MSSVGRLAPSPTGLLHLGHARTFLIAWWRARSRGGRLLLRIEDLDGARSQPELAALAVADLTWLGLDWDGPVHVQSHGVERLMAAVHELFAQGRAYACTCTRSDVRNAQSAPQLGSAEPRYPGTCRGRYASLEQAERDSGRAPGVRLTVGEGVVEFHDQLFGAQRFDVNAEVGDFLIARRSGAPAYQLAAVVDDATHGVTEVVRGSDLLPSTARQWLLQDALALPHPEWLHVPLVTDEAGRRLAKRERDLGLAELRARRVDPRAIVGWAARSAGLDVPERATAREALAAFDVARIPESAVAISAEAVRLIQGAR